MVEHEWLENFKDFKDLKPSAGIDLKSTTE